MQTMLPSSGTDLPIDQQIKIGQSKAQKMDDKHEGFMKEILRLIETKQIDLSRPRTFLNDAVYAGLSQTEQDQVDVALINISNLLTHIVEFRVSTHTPDESPELQSMIEHLWQMKQRIEEKHDVFKF